MENSYADFTEIEIQIIEQLGFENGLNIIELRNKHLNNPDYCISCGEKFSDKNVFTELGWKETKISGMCEKCWDTIFNEI